MNSPRPGCTHNLPGELLVSLTSYPARFGTLHLTLGCLLDQSVSADRTILWIAHQDIELLPEAVRALEERGLEIRACDDLRSFKKIVPALESYPSAYIVTADDDIYFPRDWLEQLVIGFEEDVITCHRAHRMTRSPEGKLKRYLEWNFQIQDDEARKPSIDILPTSGAGALYPPNCLDPRASERETFQCLCPDSDDLWLWWCARMAGSRFKKVGQKFKITTWPGTQHSSLWESNRDGGNDRMIRALENEFGPLQ